jgi:curved DNA-binding protein CbpA
MRPATVNYYDLLQVNPKADPDTIERVYRIFAQRYHPSNPVTGDRERYEMLTEAYRVLSDPKQRELYDRQFEIQQTQALTIFLSKEFTDGIEAESKIRIGLLCLLYAKRRANPDFAALSLLDLENLMAFPREHLWFAIWYLKAKRLIMQDDRSSFVITAEGVDFLESQLPHNEVLYKIYRASEAGLMVFPKPPHNKLP